MVAPQGHIVVCEQTQWKQVWFIIKKKYIYVKCPKLQHECVEETQVCLSSSSAKFVLSGQP